MNRKAFATLLVLGVIAIASVVIASVQRSAFSEAVAGREALARVRAQWAARAGVESAIARLEYATQNPDTSNAFLILDELADASEGDLEDSVYRVWHDEQGKIVLGPGDGHAKINVNLMSTDALMTLPGMTEDVADSIQDWIDADDDTRTLGAEIGYYLGQPHPYEPRNAPMRSLQELELVAGIEPLLVRGEDWNLNGILDPNEDDGDASWPPDNADGRLDAGWSAIISASTVGDSLGASGQQRLDITSASSSEIASRTGLTSAQAAAVSGYGQQYSNPRMSDFLRYEIRQIEDIANGATVSGGRVIVPDGQQRSTLETLTREQLAAVIDECFVGPAAGETPGKLNINTCAAETLEYLPSIDPALADSIIFDREGRSDGFRSITDLLDIPGVSRTRLAQIFPLLTTRSNTFTVVSRGRDLRTGITVEISATLDRSRLPVVVQEIMTR